MNEPMIAATKYIFLWGGITSKEASSDKAFNALNISIVTKTVRQMVEAWTLPVIKNSHGFSV